MTAFLKLPPNAEGMETRLHVEDVGIGVGEDGRVVVQATIRLSGGAAAYQTLLMNTDTAQTLADGLQKSILLTEDKELRKRIILETHSTQGSA